MSDYESDTDRQSAPSAAASTTPSSTTAERATARAQLKLEKELERALVKKDTEIEALRRVNAEMLQQQLVNRNVIQSLESQIVQVKEEKQSAASVAAAEATGGNVVDAGTGDGHAHVIPDNDASDDDDEYVSRRSVDDGRIRVRKQVDNGPIVLPRIPKSLQTFSGEGGSSVRSWLQQYETIRMPLQWDDRVSIAVAAMQLTDRAQQWYQEEGIKKPASSSWKAFKSALLRRFTPVVNQLFIPNYTRNISQRSGKKTEKKKDRVRVALRDLGVDDEEQVVRVFSSGLLDWIMEPLTMVVGDDHKISAKELLDHCIRIELSKSIRHGT